MVSARSEMRRRNFNLTDLPSQIKQSFQNIMRVTGSALSFGNQNRDVQTIDVQTNGVYTHDGQTQGAAEEMGMEVDYTNV